MTTNQSSSHLATVLEAALGVSEASVAIADVVIYTIIHHLPATDETTERLKQFTRNTLAITQSPAHTMLSCLTYIDRYFEAKNRFNEVDPNIHQRLLLATLITGHKYMSDVTILNSAWLEVCSDVFTKDDINDMERDFLTIIGFNVKVEDRETQDKWLETIQELTENADAFLMVKISSADAFSLSPESSIASLSRPSSRASGSVDRGRSKSALCRADSLSPTTNVDRDIKGGSVSRAASRGSSAPLKSGFSSLGRSNVSRTLSRSKSVSPPIQSGYELPSEPVPPLPIKMKTELANESTKEKWKGWRHFWKKFQKGATTTESASDKEPSSHQRQAKECSQLQSLQN